MRKLGKMRVARHKYDACMLSIYLNVAREGSGRIFEVGLFSLDYGIVTKVNSPVED